MLLQPLLFYLSTNKLYIKLIWLDICGNYFLTFSFLKPKKKPMKKIIILIIIVFGWYSADAQSNIQKVAAQSQAAPNIATSTAGQQTTVTSAQPGNYNQTSGNNAPAYTTSSRQVNSNQYISVSQSFSRGRNSGRSRIYVKSPGRNFALNAAYLVPAIKTTLVSACSINNRVAAAPMNFSSYYQCDTVHNSGILPEIRPVSKGESGVGIVTNRMQSFSAAINNHRPQYRCLNNNFMENCGMGWYSIHLASFKNLDYCRAAIRYIKSRYKTDVFLFEDFSVYNRYHLVMGKYRKYFVAENMLRKIRKEMPCAFVVNWDNYYQRILFTQE